jgi:hypothetical protein
MDSAVRSTLHHVTDRKLNKLTVQIDKFNESKAAILADAEERTSKAQQVQALLDGCKKHGIKTGRSGMSVKNVERYLVQAEHDSSVSNSLLQEWKDMLERDLQIQGVKYEYASLFGKMVTEWMQNPNEAVDILNASAKEPQAGENSEEGSYSDSDDEMFEPIGREEMHEQRKEWESYAFHELKRDQELIDRYLKDLFSFDKQSKMVKETPLHILQTTLGRLDEMEPMRFTEDVVRWCIDGVVKSDIFAGQKREALVDLKTREAVLKEMADVLNMDLDSIETWKWDPSPVRLTMRRQLNGKYRVYYDEEIHQALFLHFIGAKLAVHMKQAFSAFFHSGAWKQTPFSAMDKQSRLRRDYFLGPAALRLQDSALKAKRRELYEKEFFMTQLPDSLEAGIRDYNADENGTHFSGPKHTNEKSPLEIKESMHRLATAELLIQKKVYGEFTIVQSDFKWFGPSMPHDTIFAVLKFLGVKSKWLTFFRKFLEAPTVWSQDGPKAISSTRQRGIAMSHVLSDALGEAVLFCLDFAVNEKSGGSDLYRFHDDLLFWGQESVCIKAWNAMLEFSEIMGLELNEEKTGCVQVFDDQVETRTLPKELPKGDITWGFLRLDSTEGRWLIDDVKVEEHVTELNRQLKACRSVLAWVQAWNSYVARFLATNMGQPAACFGYEHVDMVTQTFVSIQRRLFKDFLAGEECSSVNEYLRRQIQERFGVRDVPDGFIYFPTSLGGLEVRNPLIPLSAVRDIKPKKKKPEDKIQRAFEEDEEEYEQYKKRFEGGEFHRRISVGYAPEDPDEPFMPLEEFIRFREETSNHLSRAFTMLLEPTRMHHVMQSTEFGAAVGKLGDVCKEANSPDAYWKYVFDLYSRDMIKTFGGLEIGERGMLPLGLVGMLKSERPRWLG